MRMHSAGILSSRFLMTVDNQHCLHACQFHLYTSLARNSQNKHLQRNTHLGKAQISVACLRPQSSVMKSHHLIQRIISNRKIKGDSLEAFAPCPLPVIASDRRSRPGVWERGIPARGGRARTMLFRQLQRRPALRSKMQGLDPPDAPPRAGV